MAFVNVDKTNTGGSAYSGAPQSSGPFTVQAGGGFLGLNQLNTVQLVVVAVIVVAVAVAWSKHK